MKIANEQTFREFDNFKDTVFRKKRDSHLNKIVANPLSAKLRLMLPISLIAGGLWLAYRNTGNIRGILLEREMVGYQQLIAFETVIKVMKCRWEGLWLNPRGATSPNLANQLYLTKLESDYLYLTEKRPEKLLDFELRTKFSFWLFNLSNEQKTHLINQHGDLIFRRSSAKLMLGSSMRIWNSKEDTQIRREAVFSHYLKERDTIAKECETINRFNQMWLPQQEYQSTLESCKQSTGRVAVKIEQYIERRLKQQQHNLKVREGE